MSSSHAVSKRLMVDNEWKTRRVNSRRPVIRIDFRTWNLKYSSWENQFLINTFFAASYMHIETVNWSFLVIFVGGGYCGGPLQIQYRIIPDYLVEIISIWYFIFINKFTRLISSLLPLEMTLGEVFLDLVKINRPKWRLSPF